MTEGSFYSGTPFCVPLSPPRFFSTSHRQDSHQGGIHPFPPAWSVSGQREPWLEGDGGAGRLPRSERAVEPLWAPLPGPTGLSAHVHPRGPRAARGWDRGAQFCAAARRGRACQVGAGLPGPAPLRPALVCPLQSVSAPQPTPLRPWLTPGRRAVHTAVLFLFSVGSVSPQPPTGPLSLWRREAGFRSCGGSLRSGRRAPSPAGGGPCALPERSAVSHGPAVKQCLRQRGNLCRNAGPSVVFSPGRPPFGPCRCVCGGTVGRLRHENAPGWFRPGLEPLSREDAVCFPGWPSRRGLIHGTHARLTSTVFFKGKKKKKRRRLWALLKQLQRRRVGGGGVRRRFVS